MPQLEFSEVIIAHCILVNNTCQQKLRTSIKSFGLETTATKFIF